MRHNYIFWILCCCVLAACDKVSVDFSVNPEQPRAGQTVQFGNLSTKGEEWLWSFGDNATSTLKSPSHVYKQPGTYTVILKVDNKSNRTRTRQVTIYDTIPSFSCSETAPEVYRDLTFKAAVYNPYNYEVKYRWSVIPDSVCTLLSPSLTASVCQLYFTHAAEVDVQLQVILHEDTTLVSHHYTVANRTTNSVLLRTASADYRQRLFGLRPEYRLLPADAEGIAMLDAVPDKDTLCAGLKAYYREPNGLWVVNLNGTYPVQIDTRSIAAFAVDEVENRLYWTAADSVFYMPLVGSSNNRFTTKPTLLNLLPGVLRIAPDAVLR